MALFDRRSLVAVVMVILVAGFASAQTKSTGDRVPLLPDLRITSFTVERTGLAADGSHQVRLSVQVRCSGNFAGTCGAFKIRVERADAATGPFALLGEAGVASLGTGFASTSAPTATRTFTDTVRAGATKHYLATVDYGNMVAESNEGNNTATARYSATGCAGADLVVTQVEMIRNRADGVLVHVWVRNRCLEMCRGDLYYAVAPVVPAGMAVEQGIGPGIEGETTAGPLGSILISGRRGTELQYDVSVSVRGGTCRETSTTNNACRARLAATEEHRTVTCGS